MLAAGDKVKIVDGPFSDFKGTIAEVRASEQKARVTISIYGHAEAIELDFSKIEPLTLN
jgi:transcription termination/antitermination protein NusG